MIKSYSVTLVTYMAAFLVAIVTCYFFPYSNQWLMLLAGHLSATFIVFLSSQIFKNSSLYDPFWSVAKNGVDKACKDMKISCKYTAPATFDMVEMSKLIDNAVSQKPKGIVITLPDAAALGKSVKAAISAGIPVISMNSGSVD